MEPMAKAFWMGLERSNLFIGLFTSGMDGDDWLQQPQGVPNPAIWTIGHLAFQRAQMLELLTGRRTYDAEWIPLFRLGCDKEEADAYPDIATCLAFLDARLEDLKDFLENVTLEELRSEPCVKSQFFLTKGEVLIHLSHHEAHHTGCLSLTRRLLGKDRAI
ncbi:MAG: DinB family protein [bacterium]|nr:DinB family protein [bacterium]